MTEIDGYRVMATMLDGRTSRLSCMIEDGTFMHSFETEAEAHLWIDTLRTDMFVKCKANGWIRVSNIISISVIPNTRREQ